MKCVKCGKTVDAGNKFCNFCGEPISSIPVNEDESTSHLEQIENNFQETKARTIEMLAQELHELRLTDKTANVFFMIYRDEKLVAKCIYPYLENDEKVCFISRIVHYYWGNVILTNFYHSMEFMLVTNKKVMKIVKPIVVKPKIECMDLSEITSIEAELTKNGFISRHVGELLSINSKNDVLNIRTRKVGSAQIAKNKIESILEKSSFIGS